MPYVDKHKEKEYQREYHLKNWSKRKAKHLEWKRKRRTILAKWLKEYKEKLACIRCGENYHACLDFHHKEDKNKDNTIANMVSEGYSINSIILEIKKCDVLCKNCHAKEHHRE